MQKYARLAAGNRITSVLETDGAPGPGWVELPSAFSWAHRPGFNKAPFLVDGAIQWRDSLTLAEAQAQKRAQIDAWRLAANASGFVYQGKRVATDALSMLDITNTGLRIAATQAMPPDWPGGWKAEGSFIPITTVTQWNAFFDAMYQQGLANFNRSQMLKAQVDSATTVTAVEAVTWG
jgi:hypothetical protein